jgi:RNA polymerase sigma-70 factor, ECF subfamily
LRGAFLVRRLRAPIAALYVRAASTANTDWAQIAALYAELYALNPSPVVRLVAAIAAAARTISK